MIMKIEQKHDLKKPAYASCAAILAASMMLAGCGSVKPSETGSEVSLEGEVAIETEESTTETTTEATTTTESTTESTTEATTEPSSTVTEAEAKNYKMKSIYSLMSSVVGQKLTTAQSKVEKYFGKTLELDYSNSATGRKSYNYKIDVVIEGVHFDSLSLIMGKGKKYKNKVYFIAFTNTKDDRETIHKNYQSFAKKIKKLKGKAKSKSNQKTIEYTIFKGGKKLETNVGGYYSEGGNSFWINLYNTSM